MAMQKYNENKNKIFKNTKSTIKNKETQSELNSMPMLRDKNLTS